jgi:hypothetical protein
MLWEDVFNRFDDILLKNSSSPPIKFSFTEKIIAPNTELLISIIEISEFLIQNLKNGFLYYSSLKVNIIFIQRKSLVFLILKMQNFCFKFYNFCLFLQRETSVLNTQTLILTWFIKKY